MCAAPEKDLTLSWVGDLEHFKIVLLMSKKSFFEYRIFPDRNFNKILLSHLECDFCVQKYSEIIIYVSKRKKKREDKKAIIIYILKLENMCLTSYFQLIGFN